MASEQLWQRSELMGTQVITRDTGRRLGVVAEILVDVDRREVVALGLRDSILTRMVPGVPRYLSLESIRQVGDVVLVDSDEAIEDIDITPYSMMINSEVITEAGEPLGRVRGFQFNIENGSLQTLVIASLGIPLVPEGVLSTYELPIDEIASSGPDRIIVFEGAEKRLQQLSVGFLERLGVGTPPWEKEDDYIPDVISAENQLPSGVRQTTPAPQQRYNQPQQQSSYNNDAWDDDYQEREPEMIPREQPREEPKRRYMEAEPQQWTDASSKDSYDEDYGYDSDPTYQPSPAKPLEVPEKQPDTQPEKQPEKQPEMDYEDGGY